MSFTKHDFIDLGGFAIGLWSKKYAEILSIFDLPRLQESMQAYSELEGADAENDLAEASRNAHNPDAAVIDAFKRIYTRTFITLYDRDVLAPFIVVEVIPDGAQQQLNAMADEVESYRRSKAAAQQTPVTPVVVEDPVAVCVREFHEMGSNAFKTKYLNNYKNRPVYEAAIDRGLL
jgi:hypothetical protein